MKNRAMSTRNSSGRNGVYLINSDIYSYFAAGWADLDGKARRKYFSIDKLGIMVAFRNAVIHRQKMVELLNEQGAGYTNRHGRE